MNKKKQRLGELIRERLHDPLFKKEFDQKYKTEIASVQWMCFMLKRIGLRPERPTNRLTPRDEKYPVRCFVAGVKIK